MAAVKKEIQRPRLQQLYYDVIRQELKKDLSLSSIMEVPFLEKVVLNVGAGIAVKNPKVMDSIVEELSLITGQAAVKTRAKKSIAGFKLREKVPIGAMVTLRGNRMYEFLDRLINIALPRVRDFSGLSPKSFDHAGNYTLGIKEQIIFPEIEFDKVESVRGMDITLVIRSRDIQHSSALLKKFSFPLRDK